MTTKGELGRNYEMQIRDYIINVLGKPAYLWEHAPESLLLSSGIIGSHNEHRIRRKENKENPLQDTGIDIVQVEDDGKCSLVQCKNGYKGGVTMKDLSGFMCWIAMLDKLYGFVYYTDKLSENIKCLPANKRITFIKEPYKMKKRVKEDDKFAVDQNKLIYQNEAKKQAIEHFKANNRGILSMPCGTGKTYVSYLISQSHKQVILVSPLKQFAKQNIDRYIEYGYGGEHLLVDSDGVRDLDEITNFIASNESFLISATYDSIDVVVKSLNYMSSPFFIIDEFHNLSKANITDENDNMNKLLNTDHKILFLSATPRVYELEDEEVDCDDLFGKTIYRMTFNEAIKGGYITDYKIWLPSIHEDNGKLERELDIYEIDSALKGKCMFLFSCLLNCGSRKCIVYCTDTKEIDNMIETIDKMNQYYYLDCNTSQITSRDSAQKRIRILESFEKSSKLELLFSVRILDECIDIPSCDSIFITYPSQSKIRTVQRMCRCIRVDKNNKFKVGNVFMWCDKYDRMVETLSGIKEYDSEFRNKIKVNENNFFGERKVVDYIDDNKLVDKYTIGIEEFREIRWRDMLELVKKYIDETGKRPSETDKNKEVSVYGKWISNQQRNYKLRECMMENKYIYDLWTEFISGRYKIYFISNEDKWKAQLKRVCEYIDTHNKRPFQKHKDLKIKMMGVWIGVQLMNYPKKEDIIGNDEIRQLWDEFIKNPKYKVHFPSNEETWKSTLIKVKEYIDKNNKRPSAGDRDIYIKSMGTWITCQLNSYAERKYIMENNEIRIIWEMFVNDGKYKEYFISNEDQWKNQLEEVKKYINKNYKRPSTTSKDSKIKSMGRWISHQMLNYKRGQQIMKNNEIRELWQEFLSNNQKLFYIRR
jgi:superfamily II DNA or RNA helicase